jgi:hypothetical protein
MKQLFFLIILFSLSMNAQDLSWDESIDGNFVVESITLNEPGGEGNIANVSGVAGDWNVYMTFRFTNALRTSGQGEYTANAWAEKGSDLMTTTVRGVWKKEEDHYSMKHFENTSNGSQLLTTGILDLQNKTYKCKVRFLN